MGAKPVKSRSHRQLNQVVPVAPSQRTIVLNSKSSSAMSEAAARRGRILVAGGAGYIGSHTVIELRQLVQFQVCACCLGCAATGRCPDSPHAIL
jgi:hypothetical protein